MRWNTPGSTPQEAVNMVPGETYTVEVKNAGIKKTALFALLP